MIKKILKQIQTSWFSPERVEQATIIIGILTFIVNIATYIDGKPKLAIEIIPSKSIIQGSEICYTIKNRGGVDIRSGRVRLHNDQYEDEYLAYTDLEDFRNNILYLEPDEEKEFCSNIKPGEFGKRYLVVEYTCAKDNFKKIKTKESKEIKIQ